MRPAKGEIMANKKRTSSRKDEPEGVIASAARTMGAFAGEIANTMLGDTDSAPAKVKPVHSRTTTGALRRSVSAVTSKAGRQVRRASGTARTTVKKASAATKRRTTTAKRGTTTAAKRKTTTTAKRRTATAKKK
jgi:hypothetical protein